MLFESPPKKFTANATAETRLTLHPVANGERIRQALASIANDIARVAGTVLSPTFDQFATVFISVALQTLAHP